MINLPDKYDHFSRILPYVLSGLFDDYEEVRETAYEAIEECGIETEREKVIIFLKTKIIFIKIIKGKRI